MAVKIFEDLIKEVHEKGICQMCGGCTSFCSSADYNVIGFKDSNSPPIYINKDKCLECGICYYICPQTHVLDEDLNNNYNFSNFDAMPVGFVNHICSCQATDKEFLKHGIDGGVVNSIIAFLLEKKIIDGAIVAKTKAPLSREAMIAYNKKDLIEASGIKLDIASNLDEIQKISSYTKAFPLLNRYKVKKLAIVGTPCQIYTIRCMQELGVVPSENIELCLGLFCNKNFYFNEKTIKEFEKEFKINFKDILKVNIKDSLIFELKNKHNGHKILKIPFNRLNKYFRPTCNACMDFTNIYADISFGGLGSKDKHTTVITRTKKGKDIFSKALSAGVINCAQLNNDEKNRTYEIIAQFSRSKIKNYNEFIESIK